MTPDEPTLAPEVVELVAPALLGVAEEPGAPWGTGSLVRYLAGALPAEAAGALEAAAVADPALRRRLVATDRALEALRARAPGAAPAADGAEDVRSAWEAFLAERAAVPAAEQLQAGRLGWQPLRAALAAGEAAAAAAWADLQAVAEQLALQLRLPRAALTRGGAAAAGPERRPTRAEITESGALHAEAEAPGCAEPLRLDLWFAGRSWPLAEALPVDGRVTWVVADLGALFGLPPGGIPIEWLRISASATPPAEGDAETALLAPLLHPNGTPVHVPPAVVVFHGRPVWEHRSYRIRFSVPPDLLGRYPRHRVRVEVPIGVGIRQALGAWPLAPEMEITSPWPGAPDQPMPGAPWPRLSLIGPET